MIIAWGAFGLDDMPRCLCMVLFKQIDYGNVGALPCVERRHNLPDPAVTN
jgi:hypothetical protein